MKLIFSRKGFDSKYGGMPSPILPDGQLLSLPIPSSKDKTTFAHLNVDKKLLRPILSDLGRGRFSLDSAVHLDPDLDRMRDLQQSGWRPCLGQSGSAQGHLARQGIAPGDLFLFFGWHRRIEKQQGIWRYAPKSPDLHVLFGWLEVDKILKIVSDRANSIDSHPWISDHPHVASPDKYDNELNTLYVGRDRSNITSKASHGGGLFKTFSSDLQLTEEGRTRSHWLLPKWFMPTGSKPSLSSHSNPNRWQPAGKMVRLATVAIGQEFVIDSQSYPKLEGWASKIIQGHS